MSNITKYRSLIILLVVISIIILWWFLPTRIVSFEPSDVSEIYIMDRTHSKKVTITNPDEINHIITNLSSVSVRKSGLAFGFGLSYDSTIYGQNGKELSTFVIQSTTEIKKGLLFYSVYQNDGPSIDMDFITNIFKSYGTK